MSSPRETPLPLILASTSPFRRALLQKLGLAFDCCAPNTDETPNAGEDPRRLVMRLSLEKARSVAAVHPRSLIIGSDQVACIDGTILGKPGNREAAVAQLETASGRSVDFYTGLTLLNTASGREQTLCEPFSVQFRRIDRQQIERYLDAERPYNCAGSFKSEGLGISLFQRLRGDDPNALIGLPLIQLVAMLDAEGIRVP